MLEKVFIISFIVFAVYATMEEGMIFGLVRKWWAAITKKWNSERAEYWGKPLFDCPICMCFWYGSFLYWLVWHQSWEDWLLCVISAMGVNTIFVKLFPEK